MDVLPAHLNRDSFRDSFKGLVALEIIFDLPFGFPINNIISLWQGSQGLGGRGLEEGLSHTVFKNTLSINKSWTVCIQN